MNLQIILAIAGSTALLVGLFGGGVKAKEIEVPKIAFWPRILSSLVGVVLIGIAIQLPPQDPLSQPELPTASPIPPTQQLMISSLPAATNAPTIIPTSTLTNTPLSPTATYTPPPTATYTPSPISVQIPSDYPGWFDTAIDLNLGQAIEITASGSINIWAGTPRAETDPNGNYGFDCSACIVKTQPVGLLLGRIGKSSNPIFRIGTGVQLTAGSSGRLSLLINDCCYQDNIGDFSVTVMFH